MKTVEIGKINDSTVYAVKSSQGLVPLYAEDLEFCSADYEIKCDSGAYPGVANFEQYICDKAADTLGK